MKRVFLSLMVMTTATTIVKASPVTCNNLKTMYQDSICCDNPTEEINCTHTLSINSDSTELSLEGGVLTLDLGTTIAATAANTAALNGGLYSIDTGTCASHGYGVITTAAECEAAAVALGWSDVDASTFSSSSSPPVVGTIMVPCTTIHSQPPPLHAAALENAPVKYQAWSPPSPPIPPP